jgi:hypothetical protein
MAFHGYPRATGDIDFLVRPDPKNANRIEHALMEFGFTSSGLSAKDFLLPDVVIQLGVAPNRIDLLTSLTGVDFDSAWADRIETELEGMPVGILSRSMLIANKRALGRTKDLADLEFLLGLDSKH